MYKGKYPKLIKHLTNDLDLILLDSEIQNIENLIDQEKKEQLDLCGVSKSFNSEEELLQFIYMHTPIAIKPKSKRAKGQLVSAFKSGNAFEQVCRHLAKKLFNVC